MALVFRETQLFIRSTRKDPERVAGKGRKGFPVKLQLLANSWQHWKIKNIFNLPEVKLVIPP